MNFILIFCGNWRTYLLREEKVISFYLSHIQDSYISVQKQEEQRTIYIIAIPR